MTWVWQWWNDLCYNRDKGYTQTIYGTGCKIAIISVYLDAKMTATWGTVDGSLVMFVK